MAYILDNLQINCKIIRMKCNGEYDASKVWRISRTSGARFGGMDLNEIEVSGYEPFVKGIKDLIHKKQYQVLKFINAETINLYWEIGEEIHRQQEENGWGKSIVCGR